MKKYILSLLILVFCVFIITGCNDNKKTTTKKSKTKIVETKDDTSKETNKKEENTIVGSYEIIELKDDDEVYDKKIIDSLNLDYSFEVKADNTAVMRFGEDEEKLKYDNKYFINEKEKIEYTYKKGKLVLINEDTTLTFQKK